MLITPVFFPPAGGVSFDKGSVSVGTPGVKRARSADDEVSRVDAMKGVPKGTIGPVRKRDARPGKIEPLSAAKPWPRRLWWATADRRGAGATAPVKIQFFRALNAPA